MEVPEVHKGLLWSIICCPPYKTIVIPCQSQKDALPISLSRFPEKEQMPLIFLTLEGRNSFNMVCGCPGKWHNAYDPRLAPSQSKKLVFMWVMIKFHPEICRTKESFKAKTPRLCKMPGQIFSTREIENLIIFGVTGPFDDPITQIMGLSSFLLLTMPSQPCSSSQVMRPELCSSFWQQSLEEMWISFLQLPHSWKHLLSSKRHYKEQLINNKPGEQGPVISVKLTLSDTWLWNTIVVL